MRVWIMTAPHRGVRIGVDVGGTFTDVVLALPDGQVFVNKTSTTPADPGEGVVAGIAAILRQTSIAAASVVEVVHGTTVASNTILQKQGARTGLLTTRGFRDVLEIGRIRTPGMFDMRWRKPEPLVARRWRLEALERIGADGSVVMPLDEVSVRSAAETFLAEGVEAVAICFINSYCNPAHERRAAEIMAQAAPGILLTASCDVLPEIKEYERTSTAVVNAYLLPNMRVYLSRLAEKLAELGIHAPVQVMASNGGMIGLDTARMRPVFAVGSGPAGGVAGSAPLGQVTGEQDLIVFDMGGTTAKAAIIQDGQPSLVTEYEFREGISSPSRFTKGGGYMLKVPAVDIAEVGSGGGSIARIDAGGLLVVGPESAGGDPGPACYGRGNTRPTVTDANMVLGLLNPTALAGGSLPVDLELARQAVRTHIAEPLGLSVEDAAHGIRQVANANMARALRAVTVERGLDPRDMAMMVFGGGGPLHAVELARLLGIRRVLVSPVSGVFSAAGMLCADCVQDFVRPVMLPLAQAMPEHIADTLAAMASEGHATLAGEGYAGEKVVLRFAVDLRFLGQSSQLTVPFTPPFDPVALGAGFGALYAETFGYRPEEAMELVNLRLAAVGTGDRLRFERLRLDARALAGAGGLRPASFGRGEPKQPTRLLPRDAVTAAPIAGPAIIESYDTTIVVPPGCTAAAAQAGCIAIAIGEAATPAAGSGDDPITFAVVKNALDAIVDEVAYTVIRTARSEIVKDVMDYSAAICDARGEMVAQAKTIAQHLGAIPEAMAAVQARWAGRLAPGDAIIMNDPYLGGMHLPDIFMFHPVFAGAEILAWVVVICHHTDVGGRVPGSNAADSTEIYQEGLRIPPLKYFAAGVPDEALAALIGLNVRVPDRVLGDLAAQYAACKVGAREIERLAARYGDDGLRGHFNALLDYAERMARAEIATWPKGTFRFTDHIDSDGLSDAPVPLSVAITVEGDHLTVDWAGSSPQVRAAINSTLSFTKSNTFLSVRCALRGEIPNNAGIFRAISVTAPEASVLNPRAPAAVAARALTGYRVMDTMFGALAQIVPDLIPAAGEGGNTVVAMGGRHPDNSPFIMVDMISGCWGGRPDQDGIEAITNPSQNLSNTPVEVLERQHPVRIEEYALVPDSGGAGRFRGGLGLARSYRLLAEEAVLQLRSDRLAFRPYGLAGGGPGGPSANWLGEQRLPGKVTMTLRGGEVLRHHQAGGGGHGDAWTRDPEAVAHDIRNGKVSAAAAAVQYGVVADSDGRLDLAATNALRVNR